MNHRNKSAGVIINKILKESVGAVSRKGDSLILKKFAIARDVIYIISDEQTKTKF